MVAVNLIKGFVVFLSDHTINENLVWHDITVIQSLSPFWGEMGAKERI